MSPTSTLRDGDGHLLPITFAECSGIMHVDEYREMDVDFTLDSGACTHVLDASTSAPGYVVRDSAGSRRGQGFTVGNGEIIPNEGEVTVNLMVPVADGERVQVELTSQVAEVTRPLLSVSKLCEKGYSCLFTKDGAEVLDEKQKCVAQFKASNGLYTASMKLRPPEPFQRRAA